MLTTYPTKQGGNSAYVIHNLEVLGNTLLNWFNDNSIRANPGKYHFFISGNESSKITIGNEIISSSKCEKLLGIKLTETEHKSQKSHKSQVKKLILCLDLSHQ